MSARPPVLRCASELKTPHLLATTAAEGSYILAIAAASAPIYAALACSSVDSTHGTSILLYALSRDSLAPVLRLPINDNSIPSSMRVVPNFSGRPTLMSTHTQPGCIKVWDERNGTQPVLEIHPPKNRALLSFDVASDGQIMAAGTNLQSDDASIFYWDPRNIAQSLHAHSSTHSDDITTLHFHPESSQLLLSASTDGLLGISAAFEGDEDEAVQKIQNWGCSIARAGWFSCDDKYGVWAASDMETFGVWDDDFSILANFGDVRQQSLPGQWTTDYFIDANNGSNAPSSCGAAELTTFLGSNSGDVAVASLSDFSDEQPTWTMRAILRGGHSDSVVRSVHWDQPNGVVLTGDEAGRLGAWRLTVGSVESGEVGSVSIGSKRGREDDPDQESKRGRRY